MKVSVIIPAYNAAETIIDTLESLLAQTYTKWEAIVVDNGSSDQTAEITKGFVKRDKRFRLISQSIRGESITRNSGIEVAQYDWLLFLDADDWIGSEHLKLLTNELISNRDLDAVHCGSARVAYDGTIVVEEYQAPKGDMFNTLARRAAFPVHACIVRKSLVEEVGRFDVSFRKSPDWDLWQRISRTGARFGAVREVLAFYRMQPNSSSLQAQQLLTQGLRLIKQGCSPDIRVSNPHPDHAQGLKKEQLRGQEFYLLCWCAGLLLGRTKDARPLLAKLREETFPELYPEAVAKCIFEAAALPTCQPPSGWEELWPKIRERVVNFLTALEAWSNAPGLACRARQCLEKQILQHSPSWQTVIGELENDKAILENERSNWQQMSEEHEQNMQKQKACIEELEKDKAMLENERSNWQQMSEEHEQNMQKQKACIEELEKDKAILENERSNWQQVSEEHEQNMQKQKAYIKELEKDKAMLENERSNWQQVSEEHEQNIQKQKAYIEELEKVKTQLENKKNNLHRIAEEYESLLIELQDKTWLRIGLKLGILKQLSINKSQGNTEVISNILK